MIELRPWFPTVPVSRPRRMSLAVRALITGGMLMGAKVGPVLAELPIPTNIGALINQSNLATVGVATAVVNGATMVINQKTDKATLDWQKFNIGPGNTVRFDQPSTTSVALNNIHDSDPSRILGTLTANGQVYLVNQNGFIFGSGSQVNVNSLVATSLNISQDVFQRGLARAFETGAPAFSAVDGSGQPVKELYLKDGHGVPLLDQNGQKVKIQVLLEPGAKIQTNAPGGSVILASPAVNNRGSIQAADGQVILAASQDKVYLQLADPKSDIRGLLVEVGTGGEVNNVGRVLAERGNVSLIGFAVNQNGIASATTSVRLNGSVRLLAREGIKTPDVTNPILRGAATKRVADLGDGLGRSAQVSLGVDSRSSVDLDADKTATAIDGQPQLRSNIEISGHKVFLRANSSVVAKSGVVNINATDDPTNPLAHGDARIYLDSSSLIDVSGVRNVSLPMSRNELKVELRNNELRDSPLQRNGVLHGKTVSIDLRDVILDASGGGHIAIADVSGALARIARNIDERSTSGGTINLSSTGDIITRPGSLLNFAGGSVAYRDGYIRTTKLIDAAGRVFDIGKADPNHVYKGVFGEWVKVWTKWGITERWSLSGPVGKGSFEKGYVEGKAGGALNIAAFEAMLDGLLKGDTVDGKLQRLPEERAAGSRLSIDLSNNSRDAIQGVIFANNVAASPLRSIDPFPRVSAGSDQPRPLTLDGGAFKQGGIQNVAIKTNGTVEVSKQARIELPANGSLDLAAAGFNVQGKIAAPSGQVKLAPVVVDGETQPDSIVLGETAEIDARGQWVNDWLDSRNGREFGTVSIDGGSVSLKAEQGDLNLEKGSRIDVSAGAWYQSNAKLKAGQGGSIQLTAVTSLDGGDPSSLILEGSLSGWALEKGGSLHLNTNEVLIGDSASPLNRAQSGLSPLILAPGFFQQGGFADFALTSNVFGLRVGEGVQLRPLQRNLKLSASARDQMTGEDLRGFSDVTTLDPAERNPANLSLTVAQVLKQDREEVLSIGKGALIQTDPKAAVTLNSDTSIVLDGIVDAPAGKISLNITTPSEVPDSGFYASQGIWLGSDSRLLAKGVYLPKTDATGLNLGEVLAGGDISLTANRGYIVGRRTSLVDVSGDEAKLDFWTRSSSGPAPHVEARSIASDGGTISLKAGEGILADGVLRGEAGGPGASGGTLKVVLDASGRNPVAADQRGNKTPFPDELNPGAPRSIIVSASNLSVIPGDLNVVGDVPTEDFSGKAFLKSSRLNDWGFASIFLKTDALDKLTGQFTGRIEFRGDVKLAAQRQIVLDAPSIAWSPLDGGSPTGGVSLDAAYVALGSTISRLDRGSGAAATTLLAPDASTGPGTIDVAAKGIDLVGGLSFSDIGQVSLNAEGDVRAVGVGAFTNKTAEEFKSYRGELKFAGDLNIAAQQLYPTTLTRFNITGTGATGNEAFTLTAKGGSAAPVYSAGGDLNISAPVIRQSGVIKAPFGSITLNAGKDLDLTSGSLTSVSGDGLLVPFGRGSANLNWLYPLNTGGSANLVVTAPPEKRISLSGQNVSLLSGAKVDLTGGGDLYAYEFLTGPGGSNDVLDPSSPGYTAKFAVLPSLRGISTPYDPFEFAASGLQVGDSVFLSGAAGLPAGNYTLLPAHYALLPGAYLVTPRETVGELAAGQRWVDAAGTTVVAGRYGVSGTDIRDARWQGFAVEPGSLARTRSEFKDYSANQFFADAAAKAGSVPPQLPKDAGTLAISATASLALQASLNAAPAAGGLGGQVDISADRLAIVGRREDVLATRPGVVSVLADDLNQLNAPSLFLGGFRSKDKDGQRVSVNARSVEVSGNAVLKGSELLLAARDELDVRGGAVLESIGKTGQAGQNLLVANRSTNNAPANSDGALVRLSSSRQVDVIRDGDITRSTGTLVVEQGAVLRAQGSMLLDSTKDTRFAGTIDMQGGSLALKSSKISIGDAPQDTSGLVLAQTRFNLDELRLVSASDLNLFGALGLSAGQLILDAAAINGFDNAGTVAQLSGDVIRLSNSGATASATGNGTGSLQLNAREIQIGTGQYSVNGFQQFSLNASESINGLGSGKLRVDGDVSLAAGRIGGAAGATTELDLSGHGLSLQRGAAPVTGGDVGASWSLKADAISGDARFDLPSGVLKLEALQGDIALAGGTVIDVSGRSDSFAGIERFTPAGDVFLKADQGNVSLSSGGFIDLRGASGPSGAGSDAGQLTVQAARGQFHWDGQILAGASADAVQGRLRLDVNSFGSGGLSALASKVSAAGFAEEVDLENRSDAVVTLKGAVDGNPADVLRARNIRLAVDRGKVQVDGLLDASGAKAGAIEIYGRNGITLGAGARLLAKSTRSGEAGGSVTLDTVHRDEDGAGVLDLSAAGSLIDVSSGAGGIGGAVHLRTDRNPGNHSDINTTLIGADPLRTALEETRVYELSPVAGVASIGATEIGAWFNDTKTFMSSLVPLSGTSAEAFAILPGLEIRSAEGLSLAGSWDFLDSSLQANGWRFSDVRAGQSALLPGFLTLRAGGNLDIDASLTDAFASGPITGAAGGLVFQDVVQPGLSWSYQLIAGGDINLAPPGADKVQIRTGTGTIDFKAGGNIVFQSSPDNPQQSAAVYTVGRPAPYTLADLLNGSIPELPPRETGESLANYLARLDPNRLDGLLRYGTLNPSASGLGSSQFLAEYTSRGGAVRLLADGNIEGVQSGQLMTNWLVRQGNWSAGAVSSRVPTAWGFNFSGDFGADDGRRVFGQNVGSLGGGDVTVQAGGEIRDLSVMMPATGKPVGIRNERGVWSTNSVAVHGSGDLSVSAAGDILGGEYFVGTGQGIIKAGRAITDSVSDLGRLGPIVEMGDGSFKLSSRSELKLGSVLNPTILDDPGASGDAKFFTYGPNSAVTLFSTAGNLVLENDINTIHDLKNLQASGTPHTENFEFAVYPGVLSATAFSKSLSIDNSFTLYPASNGYLELLAGQDLGSDKIFTVNVSDADPALLPNVQAPAKLLFDGSNVLAELRLSPDKVNDLASVTHSRSPTHQGSDRKSSVIAKRGDLSFAFDEGNLTTWYFAQASRFVAGGDIRNLNLSGQNLADSDITLIQAGRDISFDPRIDANGIVGKLDLRIDVGGPGQVQVIAGRDVNLGSSKGFSTLGNTLNPALASTGASISVLAGVSDQVDYAGFLDKYFSPGAPYADRLDRMNVPGNDPFRTLSRAEKLAYLKSHPDSFLLGEIEPVLFSEIKESAAAAAAETDQSKRASLYKRGFDAIDSLFPGKGYSGDLKLVFSQIKTLAGGDINLLVPGGKTDVGLAGKNGGVDKKPEELGIVVQGEGNLNSFTKGDFNVNASRVFTMGGGDVVAWASFGDVDAGKGAKAAISAPAAITSVDPDGNLKTTFPPVISGSGIQAINPEDKRRRQGSVYLAAPKGIVDAGEAGISGNRVIIAATAVVGASNISASGGTVGVPTAVAPPVVAPGADGAAAGAAKSATQQVAENGSKQQDNGNQKLAKASILQTDVVGFGNCSVGDVRDGKAGCGG